MLLEVVTAAIARTKSASHHGMGDVSQDPEIPASHAHAAEALGKPTEHWAPQDSDEGIVERPPGLWTRLKAWFDRPAQKRDSYVSNVTDPDDRRFIPRR